MGASPLGELSQSGSKDVTDRDGVACGEGTELPVDEGPSELPVVLAEFQKGEAERESEKLLRFQNGSKRARREEAKARESDRDGVGG